MQDEDARQDGDLSTADRIRRLEVWMLLEQRRGDRLRVATAGLAAGVTALLLSWSLPWLRLYQSMASDTPFRAPTRTTATGWDLMTWAVLRPEGSRGGEITTLAMAPALVALLAAVVAFGWRRDVTASIASITAGVAAVTHLLLMVFWDNSRTTTTSGLVVAMLACCAIAVSAWCLRDRDERPQHGGAPRPPA